MPLALETVVKQLADSGIIAPGKLENFVPPKANPKSVEELLKELFKQNLLTKFQAQQVAQGRAKSLILGAYTILDKIGAGGMGQVFKAEHRLMERMVAIKMLPPAMTKDAAAVARFQQEVKAAAKLRHPNIVATDDAAEAKGVHFLVMEYIEGADLSALVKKNGPFSVEKALDFILQAAKGLEFAHRSGVIHRDIKPSNLLLNSEGVVKILDMGLARIESSGTAATQAELTGSGAIMGTVDYMAPEQALSTKHADARADIYSLGCTLYYLLAGRAAFDGETLMGKMLAHRENPIPSFRDFRDDVPEAVDAILRRMMAKTPEDRYQSMTEVIADLQPLVLGGSTTAGRTPESTDAATSNSNLTFLREATLHTAQRKSTKQIKAVDSGGLKNKKLALIGAGVLGIIVLLAAIIVSLRTKDGTLIVEVDQPDGKKAIAASLKRNGQLAENQALDFDGISHHVVTPLIYDWSHPLTVEAYVVPRNRSQATPAQRILADVAESGFAMGISSSRWSAGITTGPTAGIGTQPQQSVVANALTHVAAIFNKNLVDLYLNGVKSGQIVAPSFTPSGRSILIAAQHRPLRMQSAFEAVHCFDGTIDEVRISKVARYTGNFTPEPRFTPDADTIALYHFDEGSGDTAYDSSDNKHHAKIVGAKWVPAESSESWNTSAFQAWMKEVAAMSAEEQVKAVSKKLMGLNPDYKSIYTPNFQQESGRITGVTLRGASGLNDLSPLRALTGLKTVGLNHSQPVTDLSPLQGLSLISLDLSLTKVANLSPLKGMPLEKLELPSGVADLSQLQGMPLKTLSMWGVRVTDLSPLQGMKLSRLEFDLCSISNLSPLTGMPLTGLICSRSKVHDLTPLKGMPLVELSCSGSPVADLSVLEDCQTLATLNLKGTKVTTAAVAALQAKLPNCKITWDNPAKLPTPVSLTGPAPPLANAPFDAAQAKLHQEAWAKHLGTNVETTNSVGMKMVLIPPGEFLMGSSDEQVAAALKVAEEVNAEEQTKDRIRNAERPQHRVVVTKPLLMSATEITVGQFREFSATGYRTEAEKAAKDAKAQTYLNPGYVVTDEFPAAVITWNDAVAYCKWLSEQEKVTYRLPTEAEWEYACRAGTTTQYSFGDDYNELPKHGWHNRNAGDKSHPVGTLLPNPFGLFDMHGNLYEWCGDSWDEKWYGKSSSNDPIGPPASPDHVIRGGDWNSSPSYCRCMTRFHTTLGRNPFHGFRIVRVLDAPQTTPSVTPQPTVPATAPSKPITDFNAPEFQAWMKQVAALPAEEQVKAVKKKLVELNPAFDGTVTEADGKGTPKSENGVVTELTIINDNIADLSPVRALVGLKVLDCRGSKHQGGTFSDLSPLKGMHLTTLICSNSLVSDLSPLKEMPLTTLICGGSVVSDLSPVKEMPLTNLDCQQAHIVDLSPLKGMPLTNLSIYGTRVSDLSPLEDCKSLKSLLGTRTRVTAAGVAALQKALPSCKIDWDDPAKKTPQPAASGTK